MSRKNIEQYKMELLDKKFGSLRVEKYAGTRSGRHYFSCLCDCGKHKEIRHDTFYGKHRPQSCGCKTKEIVVSKQTTHGLSKTPEYRSYKCMIERCYGDKAASSARYKEQGVTVCDEWKNSFVQFLKDMGPKPTPLHTIDRVNNDKGYSPDNCRWASKKEQATNRRNTKIVIINGVADTYGGHSEREGVCKHTIKRRFEAGLPDEMVLSKKKFGKFGILKLMNEKAS